MGVLISRFSEEEKEEMKQVILSMLSESYETIASELGVNKKTVENYIKDLIKEGRTSKSEIEKVKKEKHDKEWMIKKSMALEGIHAGVTKQELARRLNMNTGTLDEIEQELIDERRNRGRICSKKKKRSEKG